MPARTRRLLPKLALAALSLGAVVLVAELVARRALGDAFVPGEVLVGTWGACARWDADLGWELRPRARVHVADGNVDYRVHVNAAGFRDRERTLEPVPGVKRVLVLGDSMAYGWGLEVEERFSSLLEERLGAGAARVEVVNLAVPGYGTDQELLLLEQVGFDYQPDVVLLCFVLNDVGESGAAERYDMAKPCWKRGADGAWALTNQPVPRPFSWPEAAWNEFVRWLTGRSALVAWVRLRTLPGLARAAQGDLDRAPEVEEGPASDALRHKRTAHFQEQRGAGVRKRCELVVEPGGVVPMLLGRMAAACAAHGARLVAVVLPHNHDIHLYNPDFAPPVGLDADDPRSLLTRSLAQAAREHGFDALSIDAALFAEARAGRQLGFGDGHYNALGNRVVADALAPALRELLAAR